MSSLYPNSNNVAVRASSPEAPRYFDANGNPRSTAQDVHGNPRPATAEELGNNNAAMGADYNNQKNIDVADPNKNDGMLRNPNVVGSNSDPGASIMPGRARAYGANQGAQSGGYSGAGMVGAGALGYGMGNAMGHNNQNGYNNPNGAGPYAGQQDNHGGDAAPYAYGGAPDQYVNTTIFLRPIAAPSSMGLVAFFAATWLYGTWLAGWFGNSASPCEFWPFLFMFGGVAQLIAGIYGFPARDNLATIFHHAWSSFYFFISIWFFLTCYGYLPQGDFSGPLAHQSSIAWIFLIELFITTVIMVAAIGRDLVWLLAMVLLDIACLLLFLGYIISSSPVVKAGAYFLIFSSLASLWRGVAWLIAENHHVGWWPIFTSPLQAFNPVVKIPVGEPGIKKTQ